MVKFPWIEKKNGNAHYCISKLVRALWLVNLAGRTLLHGPLKFKVVSVAKLLRDLLPKLLTALFNNMRTVKFKSRPTNAFFAGVNQMFGGFSQLTTTAEHCFAVWTEHSDLITARSAVVGGWEEPPNIWLTVAKNAFVDWSLNFRVRMLLKGAVTYLVSKG